jgi:2-polyprenyl-6-methoxyphenol hydroxylase-like FAD-dependent oxidoreductase
MAKILISGASIAGPTLAYWLYRAGHAVTVVERASAIRRGGYAIDLRGPALTVAQRMGILDQLRREATDTRSTSFIDHRGCRVATFDRGFGVLGPDDVEILRGDLAAILYELTRGDVEYVFDDSIELIEQVPGGVQVRFASRRDAHFDLVIGADGLHSKVRALAFSTAGAAGAAEPIVRHLGSAIAIFTARNRPDLDRSQMMMMARGRVASIKSDRGNATVKVTLLFSSPPLGRAEPEALRRATAEAFASVGGPIPALLEDMQQAADFYCVMASQVRIPRWCVGRVALVGDAAYCPSPLTGQGTSLAMAGAYALARAIGDASDPVAGLAAYDRGMRGFVERNQDVAAEAARGFAPASALAAWFRNVNLRLLPYIPWRNAVLRLAMRSVERAANAQSLDELAPGAGHALAAPGSVTPALAS